MADLEFEDNKGAGLNISCIDSDNEVSIEIYNERLSVIFINKEWAEIIINHLKLQFDL